MGNHSTNQPFMIAHALGAIDGHTYTNSEAAFRQSIFDGFEYLEADQALTKDNKIVIYHHSKPKTDSEKPWRNKKAFQLSYDQLSNYRYVDKYPILKFDSFLSLVREFPSTKIILDIKTRNKKKVWFAKLPNEISYLNAWALKHFKKKSKNKLTTIIFKLLSWANSNRIYPHSEIIEALLESCNESLLDRFIPQVDAYSINLIKNFYDFPTKIWKTSNKNIEKEFICASQNKCKYISLEASSISDTELQLSKQHKVEILAYGTNDSTKIKSLYNKGSSGFFIDNFKQI